MQILLGTDGSSYALAAARFLNALLHPEIRAHVDIVTVSDAGTNGEASPRGTTALDRARDRLDCTRSEIDHTGVTIETHVLEGDPSRALVGIAESGRYDLVVCGVKGSGATPFFELGSVARRMTRARTPSLLLVRKGGGGYGRRLHSDSRSGLRALLSTEAETAPVADDARWGILGSLSLSETLPHTGRSGRSGSLRELDRLARRSEADLLVVAPGSDDEGTLRTTIWTAPCSVLVARPSNRDRKIPKPSLPISDLGSSPGGKPGDARPRPRRRSETELHSN